MCPVTSKAPASEVVHAGVTTHNSRDQWLVSVVNVSWSDGCFPVVVLMVNGVEGVCPFLLQVIPLVFGDVS